MTHALIQVDDITCITNGKSSIGCTNKKQALTKNPISLQL